jgi:carbonic anhydrase/acetyltransferase-like protein (isoleucine patch superfamily)
MEICEGLGGALDTRTFLDTTVGGWRARTAAPDLVAPPGVIWSARAAAAVRGLAPGDVRGASTMTLAGPIGALTGTPLWLARLGERPDETAAARWARAEAVALATFDAAERDLPGMTLPGGPLRVADAWILPVGHWTQLLWANLLGLGPFLWEQLVGQGAGAPLRLAWAALRAGSTAPADVAARLNRLGKGASIHRNATVEGCLLGPGVHVGAGAVVRGAVLGADAVVEELALVEGAVIGRGARVQRLAMAKFSVIEESASFAGIMQLGVVGRGAVVKHGATLMDMAFGQAVRVRVGDSLQAAPHGLCGVCVGDGATLASGVRVAPGRAIPPGLEILGDPSQVLSRLDLPAGSHRARLRGGSLEPA